MMLSAELRWWWEGGCPQHVDDWFRLAKPAPGGGQLGRRDRYFHQAGNVELGIKRRSENKGEDQKLEVKGLVAGDVGSLHCQLWCKWKTSAVESEGGVVTIKQRWLRKFDAVGQIREIALNAEEMPLDAGPLPAVGCNLELTRVEVEGRAGAWWTLGLEAFGDLTTAPQALADTVRATNLPEIEGLRLSYPEWLDLLFSAV